ncbi:hypothetical protein RJ639_019718 [Escallonia herrerae]|uniref:GTD-binding domain-containing protein n=1 Tax=Escallonia herrerae TaxID=1293975 RepID=A0AA89AJT9_9ASTE|nr:hypothetical protein RJ639_019718 [Escallonia herrerae]
MGADPDVELDHETVHEDHDLSSSSRKFCSCCNDHWTSRGYAKNLLQTTSIGSDAAELDGSLSVSIEHDIKYMKKTGDESSVSLRASHLGKNRLDHLSHVEYRKVKVTSDTDSEVPFSDDESANALIREADDPDNETANALIHNEDPKGDLDVESAQLEPHMITFADYKAAETLNHSASVSEPSVLEPEVKLEILNPKGSLASGATGGHGLEELDWKQVQHKADIAAPSDLISFSEVPPSSDVMASPAEVSGETFSNARQGAPRTGDVETSAATENRGISGAEHEPIMITETRLEVNPSITDTGSLMPNYLDLSDAYKLAISSKGRQLSGKFSEQRSLKESARVSEDLKLLLSQISVAQGIELSLNDMNPRVSGNSDEWRISDTSTSSGMQLLQKRISLERNESSLSLDGSTVSEIEGETVVERLKRQVEHDRKLMGALYKELEEERNASAVATNQAMAMITRLQEEKAALHMEALQCLRLMEEQAEYDDEALQKSNDLLTDKEKEIQNLEAQLELYRKKFVDASIVENVIEPACGADAIDMRLEHSDTSCAENNPSSTCGSVRGEQNMGYKSDVTSMLFKDTNFSNAQLPLLEFEEERLYLLTCLKKLEETLHILSNYGVHLDRSNGENSVEEGWIGNTKPNFRGEFQENIETEEDDLQKDVKSKGNPRTQEGYVSSSRQGASAVCSETDLVALRKEFSVLSGRLESLEADRSFLEHSINSLRNGNDGLKFIQEIAGHLRELHRIGV